MIEPPSEGKRLRVLIVDDNLEVRGALRLLLSQDGRIDLVAEASSCEELVSSAVLQMPAAIFLDLDLPGLDSSQLQTVRECCPGAAIVGMISRPGMTSSLQTAVDRVIDKTEGPQVLLAALGGLLRERCC